MLELHPYLKRVYEDEIIDCMMCHEITIKVNVLITKFLSFKKDFLFFFMLS